MSNYFIYVTCENCRYYGEICIDTGIPVKEECCPICGCYQLEAKSPARPGDPE